MVRHPSELERRFLHEEPEVFDPAVGIAVGAREDAEAADAVRFAHVDDDGVRELRRARAPLGVPERRFLLVDQVFRAVVLAVGLLAVGVNDGPLEAADVLAVGVDRDQLGGGRHGRAAALFAERFEAEITPRDRFAIYYSTCSFLEQVHLFLNAYTSID